MESLIPIFQNLLDAFFLVFLFLGVREVVEDLRGFFLLSFGEQFARLGVVPHKQVKIGLGRLVGWLEFLGDLGDEFGLEAAESLTKKNFGLDHPGHKGMS